MTDGNEPTNGRSLERYESYLHLLARLRLRMSCSKRMPPRVNFAATVKGNGGHGCGESWPIRSSMRSAMLPTSR